MTIDLPELSLVVLVGVSGSGKSSFARKHFKPTEVISSDYCRGLVSDDENNQAATGDAFDVLSYIAGKRLKNGLLTVVDATNLRPEDRRKYVDLARQYHCLPVAIVLDLPERLCHDRNSIRPDRNFGPHVIRSQRQTLRRNRRGLRREGFRHAWTLESVEDVDAATIQRTPLWNNKQHEHGPLDIVGDIHGCFDELIELIGLLGYGVQQDAEMPEGDWSITPPIDEHGSARKLVFLGDLVDRGPKSPAVLRLVMRALAEGTAYCIPGNHDVKLLRKLNGKNVQLTHGLAETVAQLDGESPEFIEQARAFIDGLISHHVFDDGRLVVAHAGLKEEMQGRGSGRVREFCLYGETTGETDEFGLPVRFNWAAEYRGRAMVVYGHTPVPQADWLNNTICIDTGCVFGGALTALRYPERDIISVAARHQYSVPKRPLHPEDGAPDLSAQQQHDTTLNLADVVGKRLIETRLHRSITLREENATAALEVMSRFAADPRWLIYLPPTMSPSETSEREGYLEYPAEAFEHFRTRGVDRVVIEEKHMGSRAVVVICRNAEAARQRFGVNGPHDGEPEIGICYTRTGRRFFNDAELERAFLQRVQGAVGVAGLWDELSTTWICLDCELMPWSAKAQALLQEQYAAVGAAARAALAEVAATLDAAGDVYGDVIADLQRRFDERRTMAEQFTRAYRHYCWTVSSLDDLKLAPFHILASENMVHVNRDHQWHMETLARLCAADEGLLLTTPFRVVDLNSAADLADATEWWLAMTGRGGEGMVIKPLDFIVRGMKGLIQPAIKCRGAEYLRIIYGPEYTAPDNLVRLRKRGLNHKRALALSEFALGIESLERFVRREPLRRVHECVFAVLAMESEPVDPRL